MLGRLAVQNKIIDNLFIFLFAFLLSVAILSTISIIRAHAAWGPEYANADLGVQAWYQKGAANQARAGRWHLRAGHTSGASGFVSPMRCFSRRSSLSPSAAQLAL
jgi:hypothetical protein